MALIATVGPLGALSGKVGALVASHNRGGPYLRAYVIPTNPSTTLQRLRRTAMALITATWKTITAAQRTGWDNYAAATPVINRVGQSTYVTGQNMYVRSNSILQVVGADLIAAAPETPGLATLGEIAGTITGSSLVLGFGAAGWNASGGYLAVYVSKPVGLTTNYFAGPFAYEGKVSGSLSLAGATLTLSNPAAVGQRQFLRFVGIDPDGRPTAEQIISKDPT